MRRPRPPVACCSGCVAHLVVAADGVLCGGSWLVVVVRGSGGPGAGGEVHDRSLSLGTEIEKRTVFTRDYVREVVRVLR